MQKNKKWNFELVIEVQKEARKIEKQILTKM